jgi:DNA mismatch repair protein MutS
LFANIKNCNVAVREWMDEVVFLHKILPGGTDKSYGIHVAKLAGIPRPILERSKEILAELENAFAKEAAGSHLAKNKTKEPDTNVLFVEKNKSILDKLASVDVNNLTPIEAINLLNEIKQNINRNPEKADGHNIIGVDIGKKQSNAGKTIYKKSNS